MASKLRLVRGRHGDDGVAMISALAVVLLVGILVVVVAAVAMSEAAGTGRDRQRSAGVALAESHVDLTVARIQSAPPTLLASPSLCGPSSMTDAVGGDRYTVTTTVTYFSDSGEVPCGSVASTKLASAKIVVATKSGAVAGTSASNRQVETLLRLTPAYNDDLDKAIFSQSTLTMSNKTALKSLAGTPTADIYTNGDFYCRNNQDYQGSIHAQGSIFLESQCTVAVDVWAKGQVRITNPSAAIGGQVKSSSSTVSLDKATVGQQALAAGAVTGDVCATSGKCFSNVAVDQPSTIAFPPFSWDATAAAKWAANGYTNVVTFPQGIYGCSWYGDQAHVAGYSGSQKIDGKATGVGAWLFANGWKLPGPTVVISNCPTDKVIIQGLGITLNDNVLLLSRGGIQFTGNSPFTSVPGTGTPADPNLLYMIQPATYLGATTVCSGEGISLDNQVSVDATVNTLLYSPCEIRKANQATLTGQVYSGSTIKVDNQLDMTFVPLPIWGGLTATSTVKSYSAEMLYKRESK